MFNSATEHSLLEMLTIGLVLSADSFSAAVAMGSRPFSKKNALFFASASGGAEALVALLGAVAGVHIAKHFSELDHWIAFGLLAIVSLHMFYESIRDLQGHGKKEPEQHFHGFWKILLISIATSLDAFSIGVGMGIAQDPIAPFIITICLCAFFSTIAGLYLGKNLSKKSGPLMGFVGAIILGVMAFRVLRI